MTCRLRKNELFLGYSSDESSRQFVCYRRQQLVFQKRKKSQSQHSPSAEMWRNTCKLLSNPNYNHNHLKSSNHSSSNFNVVFGWAPSRVTHYCSSPSPSTSDSLKLGISSHKSDGIRSFSSSSAAGPAVVDHLSPSLASAVQLGRHYTRCYWELSKARLRSALSCHVIDAQLIILFYNTCFRFNPCNIFTFMGWWFSPHSSALYLKIQSY
jgi:hypothetical protein